MSQAGYLIFILLILIFCSCQSTNSQLKNSNIYISPIKENENSNQKKLIEDTEKKYPNIKWLYITEPLYFTDDFISNYAKNSYSIVIFYENGEWGRIYCYTRLENKTKSIVIDKSEMVEYGNWKQNDQNINISIQKCRCSHCAEDQPDKGYTQDDLKDPMPVEENWKTKQGKVGESGSILAVKNLKYSFLEKDKYEIVNFDDYIFEPLVLKAEGSYERCIKYNYK